MDGHDRLMFRVGKDNEAEAISRQGASIAEMNGRRLGGFVFDDGAACKGAKFEGRVTLALAYVGTFLAKLPIRRLCAPGPRRVSQTAKPDRHPASNHPPERASCSCRGWCTSRAGAARHRREGRPAYWGAGLNVFIATSEDGSDEVAVRAKTVKQAREKVAAELARAPAAQPVNTDVIGGNAPRKTRYEIAWTNPLTSETIKSRITHTRDYLSRVRTRVQQCEVSNGYHPSPTGSLLSLGQYAPPRRLSAKMSSKPLPIHWVGPSRYCATSTNLSLPLRSSCSAESAPHIA